MNRFSRTLRLVLGTTFAALGLALLHPAPAAAQKFGGFGGTNGVLTKTNPKFLALYREPVAAAARSTVRVQCNGKDTALGVVVSPNGFILTQASELEGKVTVQLRDGKTLTAKLVGVHEPNDLALLKVEADKLTPIKWTDSKAATVGDGVASPGMGETPVAAGTVSVATRSLPKAPALPKGGPSPNSGYLGIGLADDPSGAVISEVQPKSAAQQAGLKVNDVILSVAGKDTPNAEALIRVIKGYKPNETVTLKIARGEEELELKAKLGKRPPIASRADFQNNLGSKLSKRRGGFSAVLQHDSVVESPNLGGPLVDLDGRVVGLNISRAGRVMTYAIPSEVIQATLPDLLSGKLAPKEAQ
jgi:serine protease Do